MNKHMPVTFLLSSLFVSLNSGTEEKVENIGN